MATQTIASGVLCELVMVGPSPCVNVQHTHSTGDLRLTMTPQAGLPVATLPSALLVYSAQAKNQPRSRGATDWSLYIIPACKLQPLFVRFSHGKEKSSRR